MTLDYLTRSLRLLNFFKSIVSSTFICFEKPNDNKVINIGATMKSSMTINNCNGKINLSILKENIRDKKPTHEITKNRNIMDRQTRDFTPIISLFLKEIKPPQNNTLTSREKRKQKRRENYNHNYSSS